MAESFEIIIVYGTNKSLTVNKDETIANVKLAAMSLFGIPAGDAAQYVLRAKHGQEEITLNDNETVEQAKLHPHEKVTLASGVPFGFQG